ncbi:MAG: aminoacyl-tRNA deacylase [Gracilibacter sp. BRH_c7a]|nr:MAG: aminoacyl-tRNA deacylase [Gracilibacter sp. BRH_c7a]
MKNLSKQKTNVIRILESQDIKHNVFEYSIADGLLDAVNVARKIGVEQERVFKTLVTIGKKTGINVFVIPGNYELDLKKASDVAEDKSIEMIKSKELLPLTGYIHGGCSPIGMKKDYPVYVEEIASQYEYIVISAGKIGLQVSINPRDLLLLTGFKYADLV